MPTALVSLTCPHAPSSVNWGLIYESAVISGCFQYRLTGQRSGQRQRSFPSSCPRPQGQDVAGRIHVRLRRVSAGHTLAPRLARPRRRAHVPACIAGLAGVGRVDRDDGHRFVRQHPPEIAPPGLQDGPVQPGFLPHVRPRLFGVRRFRLLGLKLDQLTEYRLGRQVHGNRSRSGWSAVGLVSTKCGLPRTHRG